MHIRTGCKINFGLTVLDKREDGYHNLETVFYPLSDPFDELIIEKTDRAGIAVYCEEQGIDLQNNTLTKAYRAYHEKNPLDFGLAATLIKGVPHGAGLGGGSANAAAVLKFLQEHAKNPLSFAELVKTAAKVGADVPFFLYNTPCRAQGIGDVLTPVNFDLSKYYLLLIMPDIKISTVWAFKKLADQKKLLTSTAVKDNKARSLPAGLQKAQNDFEDIVFNEYIVLRETKETMLRQGAVYASLSGTGSSLYGLFEEKSRAEKTVCELKKQEFFQNWKYRVSTG